MTDRTVGTTRARGRTGRVSVMALVVAAACGVPGPPTDEPADLLITDARVLDVRPGSVLPGRLVLVRDGMIEKVVQQDASIAGAVAAVDTLDAAGRLLTPGFIDVHSHAGLLLGDSLSTGGGLVSRLSPHPDSARTYRRRYAAQYLPYGVTTVRDVGSSPREVDLLLEWARDPVPWAPTVLASGGALVSHEEGRTPFPGHRVVRDSADAVRVVREYHARGIRHLKLYWRLRRPELEAALDEARRLGMVVTGHIDYQVVPFDTVLDLGLEQFEHAYTLAPGAMTGEAFLSAWRSRLPEVIGERSAGRFYLGVMEYFHELGPDDAEARRLIERLGEAEAYVTPTLHLFAQHLDLTHHRPPPLGEFDDTSGLTDDQMAHFREAYGILEGYVRRMHEAGVRLTVGTDWIAPGPTVLGEMLLLHRLGLSTAEVFRAATLNGAGALGMADSIGAVEEEFAADLVLFDGDPFADPLALLGPKTVLKAGVPIGPELEASRAITRARSMLLGHVENTGVPGMQVAVWGDGRLLWSEGLGWADVEDSIPVTPSARFPIGSVSKSLTAVAAARLMDAGLLDVDAELRSYVSDLPSRYDGITARMLGQHLAGIRHYRGNEERPGVGRHFDS